MHDPVYANQEKAQDQIPGRWNRNRVHGGGGEVECFTLCGLVVQCARERGVYGT